MSVGCCIDLALDTMDAELGRQQYHKANRHVAEDQAAGNTPFCRCLFHCSLFHYWHF